MDSEKLTLTNAIAAVLAGAKAGGYEIDVEGYKLATAHFTKPDLYKLGVQVDMAMRAAATLSDDDRAAWVAATLSQGQALGLITAAPE